VSDRSPSAPSPGASGAGPGGRPPAQRPVSAAEPLVQALLDDLVDDDPVLASGLGLTVGADRLPSWSADAVAGRLRMADGHAERLAPLVASPDPVTAVDAFIGLQITRRLRRSFGLREVHRTQPGAYLDVLFGVFPLLLRELGTPDERVDALAGRLNAAPRLLEEARDNLGHDLPAVALEVAVDQAEALLELVGTTVRDFAGEAGREGALDEPSRTAGEAVAAFRDHLRDELLPRATTLGGAGRDVLEDTLRWEHVLDERPEDLAAYGREVLAESQARMRDLARELGHDDVSAAVAEICLRHPAATDIVAAYGDAVRGARQFVAEHGIVSLPEGEELEVVATPPFLRRLLPFAAYEPPGPYDARQLGYYYVTPPRDGLAPAELEEALRNHPFASMPTTGVHEAYPGHHLQIVSANHAPTLARRIAYLPTGGDILVEGWAFYCEELMEREGYLADPAVRLMRLNDQAWRACRVVIDVEFHLGAMDLVAAADLLEEAAHMNRYEAELECRRYAVEPGQAMSYLLGRREVQRLADAYLASGTASLREFHDALLSWGSVAPAVIAWGMGLAPAPPVAAALS
jgi:uncharacterized protein (DUF885 family)